MPSASTSRLQKVDNEWFQMIGAPKDRPVCLLVFDSGELRACVGQWSAADCGWVARLPNTSHKRTFVPKRFCLIPDVPPFLD
jgi:hypothetical protein